MIWEQARARQREAERIRQAREAIIREAIINLERAVKDLTEDGACEALVNPYHVELASWREKLRKLESRKKTARARERREVYRSLGMSRNRDGSWE